MHNRELLRRLPLPNVKSVPYGLCNHQGGSNSRDEAEEEYAQTVHVVVLREDGKVR